MTTTKKNKIFKKAMKIYAMILSSTIMAILMTFLYDYLVNHFGHAEIFVWILSISSFLTIIVLCVTIMSYALHDDNI